MASTSPIIQQAIVDGLTDLGLSPDSYDAAKDFADESLVFLTGDELCRLFNGERIDPAAMAMLERLAQRKGIHYDGRINVMIFPSLDAGNIAYKLCQSLGKFRSIGPFLLGFKKPVCDLSRGATTEDIISSSVLTIASI